MPGAPACSPTWPGTRSPTQEQGRAGASLDGNPLIAYGATLLIAVIGDSGVLLAQIGDGDALVRTHGFAVRPVPGDARLVANETTSLCMDTAAQDFRFAELPESAEVDLVMLSSDGYGNSFAANDWWHELVRDLAWYVDVHGFDEFSARLPEWLAESALVGGDDVTAAVLTRPLMVHVPAPHVEKSLVERTLIEEPPADVGNGSPEAAGPGPERRQRRAWVTAAVVALLVAVVAFAACPPVHRRRRTLGRRDPQPERRPVDHSLHTGGRALHTPEQSAAGSGTRGRCRSAEPARRRRQGRRNDEALIGAQTPQRDLSPGLHSDNHQPGGPGTT